MARQFGSYATRWPLGITIEEELVFLDDNDDPVDLTGFGVRAQFRYEEVVRDADTGAGDADPIFELTTPALYGTLPAWPVIEGFALGADPDAPDPTDGTIRVRIDAPDTWQLDPTNEGAQILADIELHDPNDDDAVLPLLMMKVKTVRRRTLEMQ